MEECVRCGAETELYVGGIPICPHCQEELAADTVDHHNPHELRRSESSSKTRID